MHKQYGMYYAPKLCDWAPPARWKASRCGHSLLRDLRVTVSQSLTPVVSCDMRIWALQMISDVWCFWEWNLNASFAFHRLDVLPPFGIGPCCCNHPQYSTIVNLLLLCEFFSHCCQRCDEEPCSCTWHLSFQEPASSLKLELLRLPTLTIGYIF